MKKHRASLRHEWGEGRRNGEEQQDRKETTLKQACLLCWEEERATLVSHYIKLQKNGRLEDSQADWW